MLVAKETADIIAKLTGFKGEVLWNQTPKKPLDAKVLIEDNSRAKELSGWKLTHDLEAGVIAVSAVSKRQVFGEVHKGLEYAAIGTQAFDLLFNGASAPFVISPSLRSV